MHIISLFVFAAALHNSNPVKNGWRVNNSAKDDKSYIIYAKTPEIKKEWMRAFEREKEMVKKDRDLGKASGQQCSLYHG